MDNGAPSPTIDIHVAATSPLDSLVRRASSRRARTAILADALKVPKTPPGPYRQAYDQDSNSPNSPLLHTEFRSSVASASTAAYDRGSVVTDHDQSGTWDSESRYSQLAPTRYVKVVYINASHLFTRPDTVDVRISHKEIEDTLLYRSTASIARMMERRNQETYGFHKLHQPQSQQMFQQLSCLLLNLLLHP